MKKLSLLIFFIIFMTTLPAYSLVMRTSPMNYPDNACFYHPEWCNSYYGSINDEHPYFYGGIYHPYYYHSARYYVGDRPYYRSYYRPAYRSDYRNSGWRYYNRPGISVRVGF